MVGHDLADFTGFQTAFQPDPVGDAAIEQIRSSVLVVNDNVADDILTGYVGDIESTVQDLEFQLILMQGKRFGKYRTS